MAQQGSPAIFSWISHLADRGRRRFGGKSLLYKFDDSLRVLASELDVQESRRAIEKVLMGGPPFILSILVTVFGASILGNFWAKLLNAIADMESDSQNANTAAQFHKYATLYEAGSPSLPVFLGLLPGFLAILLGVMVWIYSRYHSGFITYAINRHIADAVICCARLQEQDASKAASTIRRLDRTCRVIEGKILSAHRHRRTITRRSPRHASVGAHSAAVAGALRIQLADLDTDFRTGSKKLALMLLEIGDQYAKGEIGRLLGADTLSGVQPVSRAREALLESLHWAFMALVVGGVVILANALVPESLVSASSRPVMLSVVGFSVANIVGGRNRFSRLLELLSGR